MKGDFRPAMQEDVIFRPQDQLQLFTNEVVNNTIPRISDSVVCAPFRKFGLYVFIDSLSNPDIIHVEVEFLDPWTARWYTYKQWPFAALFWEDADTANGIWECFYGEVAGRAMRVKLTGVNSNGTDHGSSLDATHNFTVSIGVDFWN